MVVWSAFFSHAVQHCDKQTAACHVTC